MFDKVIWASNVIGPSPRSSQLSISPVTRATNFWRSWDTAWSSSPRIRSFRSVSLSCRRAYRWNIAGSESDTQIVGEKVHTFDNASSETELPVRWSASETPEGTWTFWLVRVRVSGVTSEVPAVKDMLESKRDWLSRLWKGCAVVSDISITVTGRTRMKGRADKSEWHAK